jgi:hypothetical protein
MRASNPEKEIRIKSSVGYQADRRGELIGSNGNDYPPGNTTYISAIPSMAMIEWML